MTGWVYMTENHFGWRTKQNHKNRWEQVFHNEPPPPLQTNFIFIVTQKFSLLTLHIVFFAFCYWTILVLSLLAPIRTTNVEICETIQLQPWIN